jgi:hypothetical protein
LFFYLFIINIIKKKQAVAAWHGFLPTTDDEYRFSCCSAGICAVGKKRLAPAAVERKRLNVQ